MVIKTEATPISVKERDLLKTLRVTGRNGVIKLNVDGKELNVVLNDYQSDALKGEIRHADFLAINMTEELEVDVTVQSCRRICQARKKAASFNSRTVK